MIFFMAAIGGEMAAKETEMPKVKERKLGQVSMGGAIAA